MPGDPKSESGPYCLPPVKRFNHINGISPYNGLVAVTQNSVVLSNADVEADATLQTMLKQCVQAFKLVGARAPIRIDCRANST